MNGLNFMAHQHTHCKKGSNITPACFPLKDKEYACIGYKTKNISMYGYCTYRSVLQFKSDADLEIVCC